jgi:hypothetical protein
MVIHPGEGVLRGAAGTSTAEAKQMQIDEKEEEIIRAHVRKRLRKLQLHIDQRRSGADGRPPASASEAKKKTRGDA